MEESTPNMEGVSDTWEFDNNVKYLEQERYEGTVNLERHAADSWEPPENGSDFSGSLQNPSVEHDVYDGVSIGYNAGERDTDCRKRDRGGDPEADPDVLIHPSLSFGSYPAVSLDETLLVDQVDRLNNAPTYSDGIGAQDRRLDTCNREKWIKTGDQFQGTEPRKWSFENRSLSFRSDESGGVLGDSSSPTAVILKNLLVAMMQPQQSNKTISTSVYTIINTEVLDKKRKTWQNEEVVNVIKQIATSAESEPGSPMVFVFACLLFGLKCFHSILTNMLWIERKPLPKQTGLPYHCLSMTKGLMPCSRKESIVALYESVISPAPSVLPVYMMEFHGKDTDMLHVNQQRPNIQVSEAVNVVPLPSLPDRTDVAYVSDESESPDPAEETPQWKFQHVETSLSSDREYGCSDLSSFQTSRGNIHFTGNEKPSGNTVSLHSSTKMQKGKLIYGTSSDYISNFLSQRRTPARMRGVLRHPILQNMSTEEGFQRDVHYERWKDVAEDEFGRMMVCRGRDNHTVFTFFMIEVTLMRKCLVFRRFNAQNRPVQ